MFGCKEITIVDTNPFIKEYYYLKKAALMTLSRKEFCEFLCYNDYPEVFEKNENVLSKQTYYKIRDYLRLIDYESYLFWDELINLYTGNKIRLRLFSMDEDQYKIQAKKIPYLKDDESYEKAKYSLKNTKVNFITEDINDIDLYEQYDNIFLSNIADYQKREKTKQLLDKLLPNIKDNGKIMITYMYETEETTKYQKEWSEIYDLEKTLPLFEE